MKIYLILLLIAVTSLKADPPSTHGMLVVGQDHVYLSHLPMFHSPHDYQGLLEVSLGDAKGLYLQDRKNHPEISVYTLVPERMVLPKVVQGKLPFKASLYRGHFEQGGTSIAENLKVQITKVIYFKKFDPEAIQPESAHYLLFGTPEETFLAHFISAKPDFDEVLSIQAKGNSVSQVLTQSQAAEIILPQIENRKPLKEGDKGIANSSTPPGISLDFEVDKVYYLEFGDLS